MTGFEELRAPADENGELELLAIIVWHDFRKAGVTFFTAPDLSQQLAYMSHPAGHVIPAHTHNPVDRRVTYTQEVLVLRSGRLRADLYDSRRRYVTSRVLESGDAILLVSGGHGFTVLEAVEFLEIKTGPYSGEGGDKSVFQGGVDGSLRTAGGGAGAVGGLLPRTLGGVLVGDGRPPLGPGGTPPAPGE